MKNKYTKNMLTIAIMTACSHVAYAEESKDSIERVTVVASKPEGIKISSNKLLTLPGTGNDPMKGLEALPGVVLATPSSGGPVAKPAIRGSSASDNLYLTDGLEMGYIFHNDGLSIYNPLLIDSFELKTGAWSSQYANANGGVILTQLRDPDGDDPMKVLDLSFFRSGFLYENALGDDAAFYLSFRESLVHTYVDNFIEDEDFSFAVPPRNRDYQAKFIWDIDDDNVLRFLASGAKDYIEIAFDEDGRDIGKNPDLASGERFQTYFHSQAISWQHINGDFEANTSLNFLTQNQQEREGDVFRWDADIDKLIVKIDTTYQLEGLTLGAGIDLRRTDVEYRASGRLLPCQTEFEVCPPSYFSERFSADNSLTITDSNAYVWAKGELGTAVSYQAGIALVASDHNDQQYAEPRLRLGYKFDDDIAFSLSLGRHHTFIEDYQYIIPEYGNNHLTASTSDHASLAFDWQLDNGYGVKAELFYKELKGLVVANPLAQKRSVDDVITGENRFENDGNGRVRGIELLVNKQLADDWFGWASLAYSDAERRNDLTQRNFNSEFDLPWIANVVVDYKWNEQWQIGVKWRAQSGRRYTAVESATPYFDEGSNEPLFYIPHYGNYNAQQWSLYHRLDIRADYQTQVFGFDANVYFEVLNVYASRTVQELEYTKDYSNFEKDYQFPDMPLPSVGITINF
ncbi:MAG: TonB-dependent receptor plug domain-containing protein [Psychrobium sp.]